MFSTKEGKATKIRFWLILSDDACIKQVKFITVLGSFYVKLAPLWSLAVLPRIVNFGRIQILNNIRIYKNDEYEYQYYSEFEKLFKNCSREIFE